MSLEGKQIGRYRFLRMLGSGGMGEVYLAEDARIGQQVAIKVIRAEASPYPDENATKEATRLFQREAMAVAKLDHPHILPLFDYGEAIVNNATLTYLVMPYRPEGSLLEWLRKRGTTELFSPQEVAQIIGQAAEALQHAHDREIIHQDIKPSNLLTRKIREDPDHPDILLADFGIARSTTATSSMSQVIRGTPTYMAPEQWEGLPVFATDQYALAIMAYELLTGRPPYQGGAVQMMYQHLNAQPQPPSSINTRLSADVDLVFLHALAKKPQDRFDSIAAYAYSFKQATQGIDVSTIINSPTMSKDLSTPPINPPSEKSDKDEFRATLTISQLEAKTGVSRKISLPGGHQVNVFVPAGAQDGQIIRFEELREVTTDSNLGSILILTLAIQHTEGTEFPSTMINNDRDVVTSKPSGTPSPASTQILTENQTGSKRIGPFRSRTILLIILALLVVASSIMTFFVINNNQIATENTNSTATANSSSAFTATSTSQATNNLATNQAIANTATSQAVHATATSQAIDATATSQAVPVVNNSPIVPPTPVPFQVTTINLAASPLSIAGKSCGTQLTITYTATINVLSKGPGGAVQFTYTIDGGSTSKTGVVQLSPGQTSLQYQFTSSGTLELNGAFPGAGQVTTTSPNTISSQAITPSGVCTPVTPSP